LNKLRSIESLTVKSKKLVFVKKLTINRVRIKNPRVSQYKLKDISNKRDDAMSQRKGQSQGHGASRSRWVRS